MRGSGSVAPVLAIMGISFSANWPNDSSDSQMSTTNTPFSVAAAWARIIRSYSSFEALLFRSICSVSSR